MTIQRLKKVYDDALVIYNKASNEIKTPSYEQHISRLFRYAVDLKRMDFISRNCLNPYFREALILNGYSKSAEFMEEVKEAWRTEAIWWNNGLIQFPDITQEALNQAENGGFSCVKDCVNCDIYDKNKQDCIYYAQQEREHLKETIGQAKKEPLVMGK